MVRFAKSFVDVAIVVTLSQQLGWSHFLAILPIKDPLARDFYAEMCRIERRDIRTFRDNIGSMLFQCTALSKNTKAAISSGIANPRDGGMTPVAGTRSKSIRVSEYLTELRRMKLLQTRLHQAIAHAKEQVLRRREYHATAGEDAPRTLERKVEKLPKNRSERPLRTRGEISDGQIRDSTSVFTIISVVRNAMIVLVFLTIRDVR
jgi:hypothetical protein